MIFGDAPLTPSVLAPVPQASPTTPTLALANALSDISTIRSIPLASLVPSTVGNAQRMEVVLSAILQLISES